MSQLHDYSSLLSSTRPYGLEDASKNAPLLGLDWVAAMLDGSDAAAKIAELDTDDRRFEELAAFRKVHYAACHTAVDEPAAATNQSGGVADDAVFKRISAAVEAAQQHNKRSKSF